MIQWHDLLSELNVPWRDSGKNVGKGNLGICCPFCGDDHGYHMNLSLTKEAYYCHRDPIHAGRNLVSLTMALGCSYGESKDLLFKHSGGTAKIEPEKIKVITNVSNRWNRFAKPAQRYLDYLATRGFPNTQEVADRYDLRCSPEGVWACRLLLPIKDRQEIVSWTGRDITGKLTLKYLTSEEYHPSLVYCPRLPRDNVMIVEGPLDALKIAAAVPEWAGVALLGKGLGLAKLMRIRGLIRGCKRAYFVPDGDVPIASSYTMLNELMMTNTSIDIARLPPSHKDTGAMDYYEIRNWIRGLSYGA
jgi:hypothetical protein